MIFLVAILAHLIADFYLQTDQMVTDKRKHLGKHLFHHFAITFLFLQAYFLWDHHNGTFLVELIFITVSLVVLHFIVDLFKIMVYKREPLQTKHSFYPLLLFVGDQVLHIVSILIVCSLFLNISLVDMMSNVLALLEIGTVEEPSLTTVQIVLFLLIMFILSTTVSGHVIKHVTGILPHHLSLHEGKYVLKDDMNEEQLRRGPKSQKISEEFSYIVVKKQDLSRGKVIGYIERLLVIILTVEAAYPAIGFIVAAKSLARFKQMDDRDFAEYFLLGTLTSMFLGVAYGILIRIIIF